MRNFMPRFILLILSITLAILIFVCSRQGNNQSSSNKIQIRTVEPFYYVALFHRGPYTNHEYVTKQFLAKIKKQNIRIDSTLLGLYFNDPAETPAAELEWAVGSQVADSITVEKPLMLIKWDIPEVLVFTHHGSVDSTAYVYDMFDSYMKKHQLVPAGPAVERYVSSGGRDSSVIEIWYPVQLSSDN
jgi:effector-binding domain-containing protein